jgi:Flp pilus assembly protein TadG
MADGYVTQWCPEERNRKQFSRSDSGSKGMMMMIMMKIMIMMMMMIMMMTIMMKMMMTKMTTTKLAVHMVSYY